VRRRKDPTTTGGAAETSDLNGEEEECHRRVPVVSSRFDPTKRKSSRAIDEVCWGKKGKWEKEEGCQGQQEKKARPRAHIPSAIGSVGAVDELLDVGIDEGRETRD
jgi:hypothetical protein